MDQREIGGRIKMRDDWRYVKVRKDDGTAKSKAPFESMWETKPYTREQITEWRGNIGLMLGNHSNNTISLDFDGDGFMDYFLAFCEDKMLDSSCVGDIYLALEKIVKSTRFQSSPSRGQILISAQPNMRKRKFLITKGDFKDNGAMLEILANGQQTVIPPSICSGKSYQHFQREWIIKPSELQEITEQEWTAFCEFCEYNFVEQQMYQTSVIYNDPVFVPNAEKFTGLLEIIEKSGLFCNGNRHNFTLQFCAFAQKYALTELSVKDLIKKLIETHGGDEQDLMKVIEDSYRIRYHPMKLIDALKKELMCKK
jgi:hypothetical protein